MSAEHLIVGTKYITICYTYHMAPSENLQIFDWNLFRRDVRRDVRNCALFTFFFYAVYLIASVVTMVVFMISDPSAMPGLFSAASGGEDLTGTVTDMMDDAVGPMSIAGIAIGSCVFFILRKRRFITDLALPAAEPLTPRVFIILVMMTQAVQLVYGLIIALIDELLPEGLSLLDSYGSAMESLITPLGLVYIILIGPFFEELIFRGAVMGALRRYGDNFAILFSSLLFGFYHAIFLQIPFGFVMGLIFGYAASRWSLRLSIVLHIIVNGLSVLLSDTGNDDIASVGGFAMLACIVLTIVFAIKWRDVLKARINAGAAYYPGTYKHGFSSIVFWLFLAAMTAFGYVQMVML